MENYSTTLEEDINDAALFADSEEYMIAVTELPGGIVAIGVANMKLEVMVDADVLSFG